MCLTISVHLSQSNNVEYSEQLRLSGNEIVVPS